ncbi:MAG: AAA family ATPase [Candidatus Desulfaltia sp.]|nr:AAA family ATPase [Candidatus Desulfaltia sp.]
MPFLIALAGKGGTGKTTLAGMLIKYLVSKGKTPVLAIDADSNANLNDVLGLEVADTLGNAREEMKKGNIPINMSKHVFMSMKMERAIVEADGFDLLVMGQPEGAGCYCAVNNLLAGFMDRLSDNYPYIVMDNEAGMEHISRLTTKNVDLLLVVSDTSRRGLQAASRINALAKNLSVVSGKSYLVINRASKALPDHVLNMIKNNEVMGTIPEDDAIYKYDLNGRPTIELPHDNQAVKAAFKIFNTIIN